jgi:ribose 5-phosphate isomerase RpiB
MSYSRYRFVVDEKDAQLAVEILHANVLGIPHTTEHLQMAQNSLIKG